MRAKLLKPIVFFLLAIIVILINSPVSVGSTAQYIYDDIGRLIKVIDDQGNEVIYSYDSVGNLLSIIKTANSDSVAIVDLVPWSGPAGAIVTIYGKGFSATKTENTIHFNGVPTTVLSSTPNVISVSVPNGATTGPVTIQTPFGTAISANNFTVTEPIKITISPSIAFLSPGESIQFTESVTGTSLTSVTWSVNGIAGGTSAVGTITNGLYTAPGNASRLNSVTVSARGVSDPANFAEVPVFLNVERVISNSVSVVVQPQPQLLTLGPVISPEVSVAVQQQTVSPTLFVSPEVSVAVQPAAVTNALFVAPNISLFAGPYISSINPKSGAQGSSNIMTVTGVGFAGVSAIDFYLNGTIDAEITTSNIQINPEATQLTFDVLISPSATVGSRFIKIISSLGTSQAYFSDGNIFAVTVP